MLKKLHQNVKYLNRYVYYNKYVTLEKKHFALGFGCCPVKYAKYVPDSKQSTFQEQTYTDTQTWHSKNKKNKKIVSLND